MTTPFTRALDPATGDRTWARARRSWAAPASPDLAIVAAVLRTPLGAAARDPSYGVEEVDNAAPNAGARWRLAVLRALRRWTDAGLLRDVEVQARAVAEPTGTVLAYAVTFRGRDGRRQTLEDTLR